MNQSSRKKHLWRVSHNFFGLKIQLVNFIVFNFTKIWKNAKIRSFITLTPGGVILISSTKKEKKEKNRASCLHFLDHGLIT